MMLIHITFQDYHALQFAIDFIYAYIYIINTHSDLRDQVHTPTTKRDHYCESFT